MQRVDLRQQVCYQRETATFYFYHATLESTGDTIAFSPAARSGFFQMTFANPGEHYLRLHIMSGNREMHAEGPRTLSGIEHFQGMAAYFYAETDCDLSDIRYQNSGDQKRLLAKVGDPAQKVDFRYGISFISVERAKKNLEREIPA